MNNTLTVTEKLMYCSSCVGKGPGSCRVGTPVMDRYPVVDHPDQFLCGIKLLLKVFPSNIHSKFAEKCPQQDTNH